MSCKDLDDDEKVIEGEGDEGVDEGVIEWDIVNGGWIEFIN